MLYEIGDSPSFYLSLAMNHLNLDPKFDSVIELRKRNETKDLGSRKWGVEIRQQPIETRLES